MAMLPIGKNGAISCAGIDTSENAPSGPLNRVQILDPLEPMAILLPLLPLAPFGNRRPARLGNFSASGVSSRNMTLLSVNTSSAPAAWHSRPGHGGLQKTRIPWRCLQLQTTFTTAPRTGRRRIGTLRRWVDGGCSKVCLPGIATDLMRALTEQETAQGRTVGYTARTLNPRASMRGPASSRCGRKRRDALPTLTAGRRRTLGFPVEYRQPGPPPGREPLCSCITRRSRRPRISRIRPGFAPVRPRRPQGKGRPRSPGSGSFHAEGKEPRYGDGPCFPTHRRRTHEPSTAPAEADSTTVLEYLFDTRGGDAPAATDSPGTPRPRVGCGQPSVRPRKGERRVSMQACPRPPPKADKPSAASRSPYAPRRSLGSRRRSRGGLRSPAAGVSEGAGTGFGPAGCPAAGLRVRGAGAG